MWLPKWRPLGFGSISSMLSKLTRNPSGTSWQRISRCTRSILGVRHSLARSLATRVTARCGDAVSSLGRPSSSSRTTFVCCPGLRMPCPASRALTREFGFVRIQSLQRGRRRFTPKVVRNDSELALHYLADVPLCMLAYSIDPSAAAALIESSAYLTAPVDKFMQRTWEHGVPVFGIAPPLVDTASVSEPVHDRRPITQELEPPAVDASRYR